ncbi:hypothetical protein CLV96_3929 [Leptospira meyeri]|uniref:Uncharacterized protein n=1 Tax=Leptospira meyeri TaxID=29508 RepID=A0A4R8MM28_LEPME|nr:hypothetical protein [Leptospira meyeri]TDY66550.1 hypothetical protein CLV96_3929 [Leptospira meyeri]
MKRCRESSIRYFIKLIHGDKYREFLRDWQRSGFVDDFDEQTGKRLEKYGLIDALNCNRKSGDHKRKISNYFEIYIIKNPDKFI